VTLKAAPEGTVFAPNQPVVVIEGDYLDFGTYETSILGLLCQASGVATKAARCRLAAGDTPLFSFGSRRIHPAVAPMMERSAFIGGCDGVAAVKSAELLGVKPVGTMPHALVLLVGDTVGAARAFDEWIPPDIKRVALIDTFQDEKFEALRVAEALGDRLYALRLDTPMSRRGDMLEILREVRWELDLRGHQDIRLMVSGGVDEGEIRDLNGVVDAYGVGTSISNAPVIDFSMDIVEIEGEPVSKRGKASGAKEVFRCIECDRTIVRPAGISTAGEVCDCGGEFRPVLKEMVRAGKVVERPEPAPVIRDRVIRQLEKAAWRL
jgi:nicotinate phosphoribosyltransferase